MEHIAFIKPEVGLRSIPATAAFVDAKTRSPRVIELSARTVADLRRLKRHRGCDFVFAHATGKEPERYLNVASGVRTHIRAEEEAAKGGMRPFRAFRCHDLRHTFAIRWLLAGHDIYALSRHLGHSAVGVTDQVYGGWIRRADRQAPAKHPVAKPSVLPRKRVA